jgi:sulfoquinovose isomerase
MNSDSVAGLSRSALEAETRRLLEFGRRFPSPEGAAYWLDGRGEPDPTRPRFTYVTARMAHVYALGAGLDHPGSTDLVDAAVRGLTGPLQDDKYGGWFTSIASDGTVDTEKACYNQAFVVLAAASATLAGRPAAPSLLADALTLWQGRFFDDGSGMFVDSWDRSFTALDPYRGANANMHAVESLLAAGDATGDGALYAQASVIAQRIILDHAEPRSWRIPEHYDAQWRPLLDYHRDEPDHPFQPYGATVGHGLEWSRLLLHLEATLGTTAPDWLLPAAVGLFQRAVRDGWFADGAPGFVYTTDWDGVPVVRDRMWWVVAEAIAAAAALHRRTGEPSYAEQAGIWWAYVEEYLIDREQGSWLAQLDENNRVIETVWPGKSDLYHAVQATLLPLHPLAPCLSAALHGR